MAEHVQSVLDRMVEPLKDLQDRGIFSRDEITQILARRRQSEYDLRRRNPRKEDFLRYIQAEMNLEKLRELRSKRLQREQDATLDKKKKKQLALQSKKLGDKHILNLLHVLWTRTLRKYRGDVALYLQYAEFCKECNSFQKLSQVFAEAVQLHPRETGLWIEAASHEFFQAGSVQNARVLLQRGLRINKTSQDLWMQSFALELHFCQKLMGRRAVLFGENDEPVPDSERYKFATIVYDNAIKAVSDDVPFRLGFLDQCALFPCTNELTQHILETIQRDCSSKPEAWIARAVYETKRGKQDADSTAFVAANEDDAQAQEPESKRTRAEKDGSNTVLEVVRQAIDALPSEDMMLQALQFLDAYMQTLSKKQVNACRAIFDTIFDRSEKLPNLSYAIALKRAEYIHSTKGRKQAKAYLQSLAKRPDYKLTSSMISKLASLANSPSDSCEVLVQALHATTPDNAGYLELLLETVGASIAAEVEVSALKDLLHRIALYAPNATENNSIEKAYFGVSTVYDACAQLLEYTKERDSEAFRTLYRDVLFHSTIFESINDVNFEAFSNIFDACIDFEAQHDEVKGRRERVLRLFDLVIKKLQHTELVDAFRERRCEFETNSGTELESRQTIPTADGSVKFDVLERFRTARVVLIRNPPTQNIASGLTWKDIGPLYQSLLKKDRDSWCVETGVATSVESGDFLQPRYTSRQAYCSFLVQNDKKRYKSTLERLPVVDVSGGRWTYEDALWIFFGRNGTGEMAGRPEHTDSVSHSGTWHYQLSGSKTWLLRPSSKLLALWKAMPSEERPSWTGLTRLTVTCQQGDVLVIDTKMWFHQTVIPGQNEPSVSYARDFCEPGDSVEAMGGMTNVDGMYATDSIDEGTVIFTDEQMPDGELHRSANNANCEVVELDDGRQAVVSTRVIAAGEFFCIPESDDESIG